MSDLILRVYDTTPAREFIAPAGTCSIGRGEDNDLVINQAGVSRRHAVIGVYSDGAQISDCGSQNGTFVNHRPVVGSAPINNGAYASLDQSSLRQIRSAVEQSCKSPSLAAAFQVISQNRSEFIRLADNQISPDLLAYAVLAETNGGTQNLMAKAREMAPKLNALRSMFGGDLTDSALLFVAAYYEGVPSKKHHPLLDRIPDPTQRDIWSLSRGGKFKPGQYEFVLRFIAYGIIADNPRQCGIALPRLDF